MTSVRRRRWRAALTGYAFLSPNILGFLAFTALPVAASLALSFYAYDNLTPARFVGLDNYARLLGWHADAAGHWIANDARFWRCLGNTLFLMLGLPATMAGALAVALALNRRLPATLALRTIYYLPTISPVIAVALVWMWIFNADYGLLNVALARLGARGPNWLGDPAWAKPALMIIGFWANVGGFTMLLYLAGLQGIPAAYYEAAAMDGAGAWQRFRHITWPLLGPVNFFVVVMGVIAGFQAFGLPYVMLAGGPAGATTTVAYYIFNNAFAFSKMGYASAIAWVLFFLVFGLTLAQWRARKRFLFEYD